MFSRTHLHHALALGIALTLGRLDFARCSGQSILAPSLEDPDANNASRIFSDIYESRVWGQSIGHTIFSGPGSHNVEVVVPYVSAVRTFIANNFVTPPNAVDLGCGDFNIGKQIRNVTDRYIACDVVPKVVNYNRLIYAREDVDFRILDLVTEVLPAGDVVFVRQVLQHLSNEQISRFLPKLHKYKWLILSETIPPQDPFVPNHDIETGHRVRLAFNSGVDLTKTPFSLKHYNEIVLSEVSRAHHKWAGAERIRTIAYQLQKTFEKESEGGCQIRGD